MDLAFIVISFLLLQFLIISSEVTMVMSLGLQTLLSELVVIIKCKVLFGNVNFLSVRYHFKFGLFSINLE